MKMSEPVFVRCPECGSEQGDMGTKVQCEECGYGPMPSLDYPKGHELHEAAKGGRDA